MNKFDDTLEYYKNVYINMVKNATRKYEFDDENLSDSENEDKNLISDNNKNNDNKER